MFKYNTNCLDIVSVLLENIDMCGLYENRRSVMPKSRNQKIKILYLLDILREYTDEQHILNTEEIIEKLDAYGISAERKSIYSDISNLKEYGYDIQMKKNPTGYYLADREFQLPELKILVDSVQSSKFLSKNKSNELIKTLEKFASKYEAKQLQRQVYVADRVKTTNESIYYNVDEIENSISSNKKIEFKYYVWNVSKKLIEKNNGQKYVVSPISLVWSDENYYLVAVDHNDNDKIKHYRVDKMKSIGILDEKRKMSDEDKKFNLAIFSKKTFGMYSGDECEVGLVFPEYMIGVIIDRFGTDIPLYVQKDGLVKAKIKVSKSKQFFGWLTGLGGDVKMVEPASMISEYKEYLKGIVDKYE